MEQHDVERIARAALRELGMAGADMTVMAIDGQPGQWRIDLKGPSGPSRLKIKCGEGSSAQWVRTQIFDQVTS